MPMVRSYYRRAPGMASAAATVQQSRVKVVVYNGAASTTALKFRGRQQLSNLQFNTQLPGGFGQCSFTVSGAAAQEWGIDAGQKVIVWNGRRVAWMGWIEDVQRGSDAVSVLALGPYQELRQRIVSGTYTATTDSIINDALDVCSYVSANRSKMETSRINLTSYEVTRAAVASVVETMCDAGNDRQQRMLFALWQPETTAETPLGPDILYDGGAEKPIDLKSWYVVGLIKHSGAYSAVMETGSTSISHPTGTAFFDTSHLCKAATPYNLKFWLYVQAPGLAALTVTVALKWYSSASALLQTDSIDITASELSSGTWTEFGFDATSHASAYYVMVSVSIDNATHASIYIDDATLREYITAITDKLATPHFWALDLTDYDYTVRNAAIDFEETTNSLANYVLATYGASSVTAAAQDSASQTAYRQRDVVIAAGSDATQVLAEAQRDAYLAAHSETVTQLAGGNWSYQRISTELLDKRGKPADLAQVRAGDRVKVLDGRYAGSILLISKTEWRNGQLTITPERYADVAELLARSV